MVQMISHGFVSGAMFSCVGVLYDRMHSRMIKDYGGVVNTMPWFAALFVLFAMANAGLPGTTGFVGEFMVIIAAFQAAATGCLRRRHDADLWRRLYPVDGQARGVRRGRQPPCRRVDRHQRPRGLGAGLFRARRAGRRHLSEAADRPDGRLRYPQLVIQLGTTKLVRDRSCCRPSSTSADLHTLIPELFVCAAAFGLLMVDLFLIASSAAA